MTDSRYEGICIGGPYDGRQHCWDLPYFEVAEMPPLELAPPRRKVTYDMTPPVQKTVYDWVTLTHIQGVWLHESRRREGVGNSIVAVECLLEEYGDSGRTRARRG